MKIATTIAFLWILSTVGLGAIIHVKKDYPTIQEAIDAAERGDTIVVAPGIYEESIDFKGKAITVKSIFGPEVTVIDGMNGMGGPYGCTVLFGNEEEADSVLQGFTVTNGIGYKFTGEFLGGGIACINASPTVRENIVKGNRAFIGGGIICVQSDAVIEHNVIEGNVALHVSGPLGFGGGVACLTEVSTTLNANIIHANSADFGGGIYLRDLGSAMMLSNNIIDHNTASQSGGGIFSDFTPYSETVINNTLVANTAAVRGGGLFCHKSPYVVNSILWDNTAPEGPEIYGAKPKVRYSNVKGGWTGLGNIDVDPDFIDGPNGDYHITYRSACRSAGNNTAEGLPAEDMEGDPRKSFGSVDIGADEFNLHLYITGDTAAGGAIEGKFIGAPGSTPVGLFLSTAVLDPPMPCAFGLWHLQLPAFLIGPLGTLNLDGVMVLPTTLPTVPPAPYDIPMQAIIGNELTNLCVMKVR